MDTSKLCVEVSSSATCDPNSELRSLDLIESAVPYCWPHSLISSEMKAQAESRVIGIFIAIQVVLSQFLLKKQG